MPTKCTNEMINEALTALLSAPTPAPQPSQTSPEDSDQAYSGLKQIPFPANQTLLAPVYKSVSQDYGQSETYQAEPEVYPDLNQAAYQGLDQSYQAYPAEPFAEEEETNAAPQIRTSTPYPGYSRTEMEEYELYLTQSLDGVPTMEEEKFQTRMYTLDAKLFAAENKLYDLKNHVQQIKNDNEFFQKEVEHLQMTLASRVESGLVSHQKIQSLQAALNSELDSKMALENEMQNLEGVLYREQGAWLKEKLEMQEKIDKEVEAKKALEEQLKMLKAKLADG